MSEQNDNLQWLTHYCQINLRGPADNETFARTVHNTLGLELPGQVGSVSRGESHKLMALGPDEWLYVSESGYHGQPYAELCTMQQQLANQNITTSVVEVSDARDIMVFAGGPEAVNTICPLDMRPGAFPAGTVQESSLGHTSAYLYRRDEQTFELYILRSMCPYVEQLLKRAL